MATFTINNIQSTDETKTYTIDYTNELPTGGTVTGGTVIHTPPSGTASVITASVTSPYVYATFPTPTVVGNHYLDVIATFSDGDISEVRIVVSVVYPEVTARAGMLDLISEVRTMAVVGVNEYTISNIPYWSDYQIQRLLDKHGKPFVHETMTPDHPKLQTDRTYAWTRYFVDHNNIEETTGGTAIFYIQDKDAAIVSSATYTVDYINGIVTFAADTTGAGYYVTGTCYDMNGVAAEIWQFKANNAAKMVNFTTDGHNMSMSSLYKQYMERAEFYRSLSWSGSGGGGSMTREDTDA